MRKKTHKTSQFLKESQRGFEPLYIIYIRGLILYNHHPKSDLEIMYASKNTKTLSFHKKRQSYCCEIPHAHPRTTSEHHQYVLALPLTLNWTLAIRCKA